MTKRILVIYINKQNMYIRVHDASRAKERGEGSGWLKNYLQGSLKAVIINLNPLTRVPHESVTYLSVTKFVRVNITPTDCFVLLHVMSACKNTEHKTVRSLQNVSHTNLCLHKNLFVVKTRRRTIEKSYNDRNNNCNDYECNERNNNKFVWRRINNAKSEACFDHFYRRDIIF